MMEEPRARVLVVDDHRDMAEGLAEYLRGHGYTAQAAAGGAEAVQMFAASPFDVVITDLRMTGMDGMGVLEAVHKVDPGVPVFIMTAYGSIENAIEAIRHGAFHYFGKPLKVEEVRIYLERALQHRRMEISHSKLLRDIQERYTFESMVARSSLMRKVFDMIERVASSPACVLISGASGTGKELVARAIHFRGDRARRAFVPINCAAIPANLLESEIFGYEAGAFTGANRARAGLALEAAGGTLFLDEVGELPLELQPKLLRLLQEGEVRALGSDKPRQIDVRMIAATNIDLEARTRTGGFRSDLYYRLNVVPIHMPTLRERPEDIPILAEKLLQRAVEANPRLIAQRLSAEAVDVLLGYSWPGNVRELENAVERAATLCKGNVIEAEDLRFLRAEPTTAPMHAAMEKLPSLRDLESQYIDHVLLHTEGSKVKAAAILGVDPSTLYRREKSGS